MLAYRVREHNKKNATREIRATKQNSKRIKNQIIPRWGGVQMTQAERTRTIRYVLAESSWCADEGTRGKFRYRDAGKKQKKESKNEKRKAGSKARKQASNKSYSRRLHSNKSSRLCYKAETGTLPHHRPSSSCSRRQRYQVSLLPLSTPLPRKTIR